MSAAVLTAPCAHAGGCPCPVDEHPCRACGRHQGECDGPPIRCCEACEHWIPLPHPTDDTTSEDGDPR